jgi:hypothetical protein
VNSINQGIELRAAPADLKHEIGTESSHQLLE